MPLRLAIIDHLDAERLDLTALRTDGDATPETRFEELDPQNTEVT